MADRPSAAKPNPKDNTGKIDLEKNKEMKMAIEHSKQQNHKH